MIFSQIRDFSIFRSNEIVMECFLLAFWKYIYISQLDGKCGDPKLNVQSANHLEWIDWHQSFRLGCVRSPASLPPHSIKKFKTVQGPNCLVLSKVMSLTFVQGSILGGIAVLHAQIGPPSTKLGQAFFCCGRGPNIYQLWTGWADLSMWYGDSTQNLALIKSQTQ